MAKRLTLDVISMIDDFFEGTFLMAIVCGMQPTAMVFNINHRLDLRFSRDWQSDIQLVKTRSKAVVHFPMYQWNEPIKGTRHILYHLKSGKDRLLPELKNMDYLWLIQGASAQQETKRYAEAVAKISGVQLVQQIPLEKLQNAHHLLV